MVVACLLVALDFAEVASGRATKWSLDRIVREDGWFAKGD